MKTINLKASRSWNLASIMEETRYEAFKVEVLQDYSSIDKSPSLLAWMNGEKQKSMKLLKAAGPNEWHKKYRDKPYRKVRVHVVEYPLTPYLEWELEVYKYIMIPFIGEEVYLVEKSKLQNALPDGDFWVFDNKRVAQFHYNQTSAYSVDIYDENDDISSFITVKKELINLRKPLT